MRMVELPLEFGGQGRTYLYKMGCVPAGVFFFFILEYFLLIIPRLFKVSCMLFVPYYKAFLIKKSSIFIVCLINMMHIDVSNSQSNH